MKIDKLTLNNFRSFEELSVNAGNRLTLLIGENGKGKSTILDGIAVALGAVLTSLPGVTGISFKKTDLRQFNNKRADFMRVRIKTVSGLSWERLGRRDKNVSFTLGFREALGLGQLRKYINEIILDPMSNNNEVELPVLAYYGVNRALLDVPLRRRGFPKSHKRFEAYNNALNSTSRFKSTFIWFYNKENEELRRQKELKSFDFKLPELETIRKAISLMFNDLSEPHILTNPLRFVVKAGDEILDITQLSDGYKTLLSLVMDLASRMALANPHLENPLNSPAIVLIDEIDLHLHPEWQKNVVGQLLSTFPNTQFFLTTHSPYIVESVNNLLMKYKLQENNIQFSEEIEKLFPLSYEDTAVYHCGYSSVDSLLDPDIKLIDDKLINPYNNIAGIFDNMSQLLQNQEESLS